MDRSRNIHSSWSNIPSFVESPRNYQVSSPSSRTLITMDTNYSSPLYPGSPMMLSPRHAPKKIPEESIGYLTYKNDALKFKVEKEKLKHECRELEARNKEYHHTINSLNDEMDAKDTMINRLSMLVTEREKQFQVIFKENNAEFVKILKDKDEMIEKLNRFGVKYEKSSDYDK